MSSSQDAATGDPASLDASSVTAFLRAEAALLARGLSQPTAPALVRAVLDQHDEHHSTWLELLALLERRDASVAALLAELYVQHGRSAGALERAQRPTLPAALRRKVLDLHARELEARTAEVAAAVATLATAPPRGARRTT